MCGIAGFSWSKECTLTNEQKRSLLLVASVGADKRGGQSYGYLIAGEDGPIVHRAMGPLVGANFDYLAKTQLGYLHSRFATQGSITIENCHPFEYKDIILGHNGVLSNATQLDSMFGNKAVDSEHIAERIALGDNLEAIRGYGIIEYFDKKYPNRIYLVNIGNGSCSLFEIWSEDNKHFQGYLWTSLSEDGLLALASAGITSYDEFTLKEGVIYYFERGSDQLWIDDSKEYRVSQSNHSNVWVSDSHKIDFNNLNEWNQQDDEELSSEYPSLRNLVMGNPSEFWENYKSAKGLDLDDESDYLDQDTDQIKKVLG